ncbi:MAG: hypothetical protein IJJ03_08230, partial [Mogibacterium sp.]|nr:hypothetical protein [Mogibacterium sp.]
MAVKPLIAIRDLEVHEEPGLVVAEGRCIVKLIGSREKVDTDKFRIDTPLIENAGKISFASRFGTPLPGGICLNRFRLTFSMDDVNDFDIQNKVVPVYGNREGGRFLYELFDLKTGHNRHSRIIIKDGMAMYFRQTIYNTLTFTVREANIY